MDAHLYTQMERGLWAEQNPSRCPCRGNGWFLSDWDIWFKCPIHGWNVPHPDEEAVFDDDAHWLHCMRSAYTMFRIQSGMTSKEFRANIEPHAPEAFFWTPADWVNAAEELAVSILREREEEQAHADGFDCALEARLAEEAELEREYRE